MKGFKSYTKGSQVKSVESDFRTGFQGTLEKSEGEKYDQYGKPGTSAKKRQADMFDTSMPTSRYRSRRP
jgi:hypothetical protein